MAGANLKSPGNGATVAQGDDVVVTCVCDPPAGETVASVDVVINGTGGNVGVDSGDGLTWNYTDTAPANGQHEYSAVATFSGGGTASTQINTATVKDAMNGTIDTAASVGGAWPATTTSAAATVADGGSGLKRTVSISIETDLNPGAAAVAIQTKRWESNESIAQRLAAACNARGDISCGNGPGTQGVGLAQMVFYPIAPAATVTISAFTVT